MKKLYDAALPIPGFPGYYATNEGRIISMKKGKIRYLADTCRLDGHRYIRNTLVDAEGARRESYCHRFVALAFHGPCPDGMQCRHLDGDMSNNRPENLVWGTAKENASDRDRQGRGSQGERNCKAKLTAEDVREIRRLWDVGVTRQQLAERFSVGATNISEITRRHTWSHVA